MAFDKTAQQQNLQNTSTGALQASGFNQAQQPMDAGSALANSVLNNSQVNLNDSLASNGQQIQQGQNDDLPVNKSVLGANPVDTSLNVQGALGNVKSTYIPGLGVLGADIGGVAKGLAAAQMFKLNDAANLRDEKTLEINKFNANTQRDYMKIAEADLGIKLQDASNKQYDVDQQQQIQQGMVTAAQQGGYEGVIQFLKTANPAMALQFQAQKLKVDDQILSNDVAQAQAPALKAKALFDAYGTGGKMAAAILNAPPEMRAQMYNEMQPMIQSVIPGAPKEWGPEAQGLGMLMMSQSTPENILYASQKNLAYLDTDVGKYTTAINTIRTSNLPDDVKQQQINALQLELNGKLATGQQAAFQASNAQQQMAIKNGDDQATRARLYSKSISEDPSSKAFVEQTDTFANLSALSNQILSLQAQGKPTALLDGQFQNLYLKVFQKGSLSDSDRTTAQGTTGYTTLTKQVIGLLSGQKQVFNESERGQMAAMVGNMIQSSYERQKTNEAAWKKAISNQTYTDNNGNPVPLTPWDQIKLPSQAYDQLYSKYSGNPQQNQQQSSKVLQYNPQTGALQ